MMKNIGCRLIGLILLPLTPVVAAWALYALRNSDIPEDHSYLYNLQELVGCCFCLITTGNIYGE